MNRLQQRLAYLESQALEAKIAHQGRNFVFLSFEEPNLPPHADRLAAFKAENGVSRSAMSSL